MGALADKQSKTRFVVTTALLSAFVLTPLTYAVDAAGGHPARSAPAALWIMWLVIVGLVRLVWRRTRNWRAAR